MSSVHRNPSDRARLPWALAATISLSLVQPSVAADQRTIELRDGSVLVGELVGADGGRYRIRTPILGEIELSESDVLAIRSGAAPVNGQGAAPSGTTDLRGALSTIQHQIAGDASLAGALTALQGDPEIQSALSDPAFTQLILSGNVAALSADPRFLRIMSNPAIQAILGQVGGQIGGQTIGR